MSQWTARVEAMGNAAPSSRGARWLARQEGRELAGFAQLAAVPQWIGWPPPERRRLAVVAALLHHRPGIDHELRAEVLAPLAALAGEVIFDAVCGTELDGVFCDHVLPPAAQLDEVGEQLLARSWRQDDAPDPYAVSVASTAAALVGSGAA